MIKTLITLALALGIILAEYSWPQTQVFADTDHTPSDSLPSLQPIITKSRFSEKLQEDVQIIPKKVVYQDDPEVEAGTDTILDEGEDGKKITIYKITYADNEEYAREIANTEITPAIDKKISRGTKIVWKTLDTVDGPIKYWKKMRVYATHYDSHCKGCDEITATGMKQGKGVIAVDPKVIKLRSKLYIPGYGHAIAGDTGGAIKGNIIDLGFEDARTANWYAHFIDIYLQ